MTSKDKKELAQGIERQDLQLVRAILRVVVALLQLAKGVSVPRGGSRPWFC